MKITKEAIHTDTEALASKMAGLADAVADAPSEWGDAPMYWNDEPDWDGAPEGATHWNNTVEAFYKIEGDVAYMFNDDGSLRDYAAPVRNYSSCFFARPEQSKSTEPQEQEWDGKGSPPVGVEFELKPYWNRVKVVAHDEREDGTYIVYWDYHIQEYSSCIRPDYFRPIQSTAERKRAKLISDLDEVLDHSDDDFAVTIADWLIDNDILKADE